MEICHKSEVIKISVKNTHVFIQIYKKKPFNDIYLNSLEHHYLHYKFPMTKFLCKFNDRRVKISKMPFEHNRIKLTFNCKCRAIHFIYDQKKMYVMVDRVVKGSSTFAISKSSFFAKIEFARRERMLQWYFFI